MGRVRIFVIWQELAEFQAEAWLLVAAWIWAISWHGGPVQTAGTVRERAAHKQGSLSLFLTWRLHARFITSTRIWTCSSVRPGRSQQLEIPPSLNSKQAACFSSSADFSTNAGFSPGAGISTPARILSSAWFSANARMSQSAWFLAKARISQSAWFSAKARISQSAWFLAKARISQAAWFSAKAGISQSAWFFLAASICTYFQYFIFLHSLLSMRQHLIGAFISGL